MRVSYLLRVWLSLCLLHPLGLVLLAFLDPRRLSLSIHPSAVPSALRLHALYALLLMANRLFLLLNFSSFLLHGLHITTTSIVALHYILELFVFQSIPLNMSNSITLAMLVLTLLFWTIGWSYLEEAPKVEKYKGPRKIFTKHYMEGNILGAEELEKKKGL